MTTHSMIQDVNGNIIANSVLEGYTTTATAAMTTTLTVASTQQQFFTGSTTQTVVLPVTSTLVLGQSFYIVNNSSGVVTVQSSGANNIQAMAASTTLLVTCILTSGTTAASWSAEYVGASSGGTVNSGTAGQLAYYAGSGTTVSGGQLGNIAGTSTNDNASAGNVGEFVTSNIAYGSPVTLTNNTFVNFTSISLTAGDWDVWGNVILVSIGTTQQAILAGISTTSATFPDSSFVSGVDLTAPGGVINVNCGAMAPQQRISLSTTTTVYLIVVSSATSGNASGAGNLSARRAR